VVNTLPARSSIGAAQPDVVRVSHPAQGVAVVTLDRPASINALDGALIEALLAIFAELAVDEQVKVVIITGAGRGFCSGADLSALTDGLGSGPAVEFMRLVGRPLVALAHLPQLTIAAVNGAAIGAGWGLAMA
jgi:enoyl-CoA hydratase/carnithine racemase